MRFGKYDISTVVFGTFRLDGGAMFGSVPKNIWSTRISVDEENCIPLCTRSLVIRDGKRTILTDVGNGEKWNDKLKKIFAFSNAPKSSWGFKNEEITDIILTHLHFDHAGGISEFENGDPTKLRLAFPNARIHLQRSNYENAQNPSLKERASYLKENVSVLKNADLNLVDGNVEVLPDIWVHRVDGHTTGQQWIEVKDGSSSIVFPTDLIPTYRHLPVPFQMGYDNCAFTVMQEKEVFLAKALEMKSLIVFQHDPDTAAGTITIDDKGHYCLKDKISL